MLKKGGREWGAVPESPLDDTEQIAEKLRPHFEICESWTSASPAPSVLAFKRQAPYGVVLSYVHGEARVPWAGSAVELWSQSSTELERAREQAVIAQ